MNELLVFAPVVGSCAQIIGSIWLFIKVVPMLSRMAKDEKERVMLAKAINDILAQGQQELSNIETLFCTTITELNERITALEKGERKNDENSSV